MNDLEALQEHLKYDQIDILGHSWGGILGMAYKARYPKKVRRLILVDSAAPRLEDTLVLFKNIFSETVERQNAIAFVAELGDEDAIQSDLADYLTLFCYSAEKGRLGWLRRTRGDIVTTLIRCSGKMHRDLILILSLESSASPH